MMDATRIGVYGASGSGKSTRVKALLQSAPRVVVFDPMAEYARPRGPMAACHSLAEVLAGLKRGWARGFKLAYVPPAGSEPDALHRLSLLLLQAQRPYFNRQSATQITLVVEEMNLSFPVAELPRELKGFKEICSRGRHYGINVLGVTQLVAEISTRFRGNTDGGAYVFMQGADTACVRTAARLVGAKWAPRLVTLQPHEYLFVRAGQVTEGRNVLKGKRA